MRFQYPGSEKALKAFKLQVNNSLVVQWLGLHASTAGAMGLIPICYSSQKKKKKNWSLIALLWNERQNLVTDL